MPTNVPPASTVAPSPCSARRATASSTERAAIHSGSLTGTPNGTCRSRDMNVARSRQHLDHPRGPIDPDAIAGLDSLARVSGPDDGRDPELTGDDRGMGHRAAGLGDQSG